MRILHVAAELYPYARTGGLGDVLAALPPAERTLRQDVRLLLPAYPAIRAALGETERVASVGPRFGAPQIDLLRGTLPDGSTLYALDAPSLYDRPGSFYLGPDGHDWPDNARRFGLLGWAAAALAAGRLDPSWKAKLLHAHDWHAGLAPTYLRLMGQPADSVFTIHNIAFQGLFPAEMLPELELPWDLFRPEEIEFWGKLSFIKAGIVHAERVTTVSPGYAAEIATEEFGCGLEGVIRDRGAAVSGILNGVDETLWDPKADPALAAPFSARGLAARAKNRAALLDRFGLPAPDGPVFGVVSRLTPQKGLDLVLEALPALLETGGALVLLGTGDAPLERDFVAAAKAHPDRIAVTIGFDEKLSRAIIGGSDAILVPSRFEPCGLTQLYALRYGAVPVVRRTGGLGNTVSDATPAALAANEATGIVFADATAAAVGEALARTAALYRNRPAWRKLQATGMAQHFSWSAAAKSYLGLYRGIAA